MEASSVITCVIGIGNLSKAIKNSIAKKTEVLILSSRSLEDRQRLKENLKNKRINLILNNFQKSNQLSKANLSEITYNSIQLTSILLDLVGKYKSSINKIIYTSSSSVYGNRTDTCKENSLLSPCSIHGSLKLTCETLVTNFCMQKGIDFTIARVFNVYGGDDDFSIIFKLLNSIKQTSVFNLCNQGQSVRDFIHVDDCAYIYHELLKVKRCHVINIGTGIGTSIKSLIDQENKNHQIKINNIYNEKEIPYSVADISKLQEIVKTPKFKKIQHFIECELNESQNN